MDRVVPEDLPAFDAGIARSAQGAQFDLVFRIRTARGGCKYPEQALNKARSELAHMSRV